MKSYGKELAKYSQLDKFNKHVNDEGDTLHSYSKITNRIWLGDYKSSEDKEFFKKNNIKAVLNCTKDLPNTFVKDESIQYLRIPLNDSLKEVDSKKMYYYFPVIIEFLNKIVNIEKKNILVHCVQGKSRSCISVAIFLVSQGVPPEDALRYVLKKRPDAFFFGLSINFDEPFSKYVEHLKTQRPLKKY